VEPLDIDEPAAEQVKEEEVTVTMGISHYDQEYGCPYLRRKQKFVLRERARNA
jgi:hypothetical protein